MPNNMFDNVEDIKSVVGEAVGAGSRCWSEEPTGVFRAEQAALIVEHAAERIREIYDESYNDVEYSDTYAPEESQHKVDTAVRIAAAQFGTSIPWGPTEPITDEAIVKRMNTIYEWLLNDDTKGLTPS